MAAAAADDLEPNSARSTGAGLSRPVIYASFWGRLWQSDPARLAHAGAIAQALATDAAQTGRFVQSSFYFDEAWYARDTVPPLTPFAIKQGLQILINRGVVPEADGWEDGSTAIVIVFPDETLTASGEAAGGDGHTHFKTKLGNASYFGIVAAGQPGGAFAGPVAARAAALARAICAGPAGEDVWVAAGAGLVQGSAPHDAPPAGPTPVLPSLHVTQRVPRFRIDEAQLERYLTLQAYPETLGAAGILRQAAAAIEAKVAKRATRPSPATAAELQDFANPNPRVTIAERIAAMKHVIGADDPDVAIVEEIANSLSEPVFADLRVRYFNDVGYVFFDVVYWLYYKLKLAKRLGLHNRQPLSILDIGCGGGHFARVCEYFGHSVIGTDIKQPSYADIATALGVQRTIDPLAPNTPTTDYGRKFDLITASQIEFDRIRTPGAPPAYWTLDHWRFLFNDLMARQLNFPAHLHLYLNHQMRDGKGAFDIDLLRFCAAHGAEVDETSGFIDWTLNAPVQI